MSEGTPARRPVVLGLASPPAPVAEPCQDACCAPASGQSTAQPDLDCCGNEVTLVTADEGLEPWYADRALLLPAVSGVTLLTGYGLAWLGLAPAASVVHVVALLAGAATFVPGALRNLAKRRLGVGLLMTIAAAGAVLLGHVGEAAALAFLFSISEALEERAMRRARHGLRALLDLIPPTAVVLRGGVQSEILAENLRVGDLLVVRPGDRVATDGVIADGRSSLDTSAVTGESIPVDVAPGDAVPAGSINGAGALRVRATADGTDNSLTTIVQLVSQASARKGAGARLADRIARPLVPGVLLLALAIVAYGFVVGDPAFWVQRALVVLVAVSPCALAIAVPVTVISAIGSASRFGVIVKSGEAFEKLGAVTRVAFDKTGTLTRNHPEVVDVVPAAGHDREEVLRVAAALERHSAHPLATAILAAASGPLPSAAHAVEEPGHGVRATVDGRCASLGSTRWLDPGPLTADAERLEASGMTVVVVALEDAPAGLIGIRDELRPEASETIALLHRAGVTTAMLTGDNARTAAALAAQAGIDELRAEQRPQDKASAIQALRGHGMTAMVGDGVNDAPALAAADVGIAMGATGSAAAIETADVAFTGTDLRLIPQALAHARRGRRIMLGNIGLALAIIVVLLPLALFGVLGLATVVLIHESAEVVVILNGMRAAQRRPALREAQA